MTMDAEIYSAVLHRVAQGDHGWGGPYDFAALYVLDHAVPSVEHPDTDLQLPAAGRLFDKALQSALRSSCADLPPLTFVQSFQGVCDTQRRGTIQIRDRGGFIALGPITSDTDQATVGAMFYAGHRWARWLRYHLQREDSTWRVVRCEVLAVS